MIKVNPKIFKNLTNNRKLSCQKEKIVMNSITLKLKIPIIIIKTMKSMKKNENNVFISKIIVIIEILILIK